MGDLTELAERWRADLAGWAIPEHITAAVGESPWVLPRQVFARRADRLRRGAGRAVLRSRAGRARPAGERARRRRRGGRGLLAAAPQVTALTAVDTDDGDARPAGPAGRPPAALPADRPRPLARRGRGQAGPADLVTCHHVLYNVPDLVPFIEALTAHARRRWSSRLAARHPLISLNPLWLLFHGLARPAGPAADDLLAILDAMGLGPGTLRGIVRAQADYATGSELVEVTRRRLCLPPERASEVAAALREAGQPGQPVDLGTSGREVVTIWWEGSA